MWGWFCVGWAALMDTLLVLRMAWLRLLPRFMRPAAVTSSDTVHKIVCIGDGTVEGYGDTWKLLGRPGFPARLQDLLDETDKVRQTWVVVNRGHHGSCTDDWLPEAESKPSVGARWVRHTLWRDAMASDLADADIVLVSMGAMDNMYSREPRSASNTVKNISHLCEALQQMGKLVLVAPVPPGGDERGFKRRNLERNTLLWKYLEDQRTKPERPDAGSIAAGAGWTTRHPKAMYNRDQLHFNSNGHALRADEWGNALLLHMLQMEWKSWQKLLKSDS